PVPAPEAEDKAEDKAEDAGTDAAKDDGSGAEPSDGEKETSPGKGSQGTSLDPAPSGQAC
ncbi:hypothetical protein, partial [Actinomadura geliboluensis]